MKGKVRSVDPEAYFNLTVFCALICGVFLFRKEDLSESETIEKP